MHITRWKMAQLVFPPLGSRQSRSFAILANKDYKWRWVHRRHPTRCLVQSVPAYFHICAHVEMHEPSRFVDLLGKQNEMFHRQILVMIILRLPSTVSQLLHQTYWECVISFVFFMSTSADKKQQSDSIYNISNI